MYKRQIDNIDNIKSLEIYGSSNKGAYFSLSSFLEVNKPFNGLYINKNKVILSNIFENIVIGNKEYDVQNLNTISDKISNKEYILEIDLDTKSYVYRCQNVTYTKKIYFVNDTDILVVDYEIKNENDQKIRFNICPLITYRDVIHMKKANFLKFGSRQVENGVLINLSIVDNENLVVKCNDSKYIETNSYCSNVKHETLNLELKKDIFIEDLYMPGKFEVELKPNETKNVKVYISKSDIDIKEYMNYSVENVENESEIDEEYVELKKLKKSLDIFKNTNIISIPQTFDVENLYQNLNDKNINIYLNELLFVIKSLDGRYISLNELNEAKSEIEKCIEKIKSLDKFSLNTSLYYKLKFWLVEIINKLYEKDDSYISKEIKEYVGSCVLDIQKLLTTQSYDIVKYVEIVSLMYNTLKIYEDMFKDPSYDSLAEDMKSCISNNFWCEQVRVLKKDLDDLEICASIDMIYAISLSYSVATKDIQIKLLDTIFRELYTPYGIRNIAKGAKTSNGLVFPKYMAHFISANLNQNGMSYVAKKIAYNLVKDLLSDIGKYVENTVKYVYSEKGLDVDFKILDLYTTCELIRLYTMFM